MNQSAKSREDFLRTTALLRVKVGEEQFDFRFPDNIYMRNVLAGIFQGQEYSLVNLPGYSPTKIVDIGANVGATAFYFHHSYPEAEIWCYEPCQENFWCLEENIRTMGPNIHVFPYGLLDRDCELPIYYGNSQCGQNSLVHTVETAPQSTETVRLVKAGREAAERRWEHLSIVKMDTEGCEVPILSELLTAVPKIDLLYCEYHSEDDRRAINALTESRFVLASANAGKPHQGTCVYWSREILQRYPSFDSIKKSMPRSRQ